jgi:phosphoglycerol transferase MdoB-like AlkP superfamily enzyme
MSLAGLATASTASQVEPGVLGFLVVAAMGVALFFLLRSMNKQLHKVSADRRYFSKRAEADAQVPADPPAGTGQDC